jgi:sugar phosphate isomerase/epimerase
LGGCVIIRGSRAVQGSAATISLDDLKSQVKGFLESLKPELEVVEQNKCVLAIENHSGRSLLNTLDSIKIFADLNRSASLGIALAPYHIQKNGESVEQAIRAAGEGLKFFYAWQQGEGTKQLPGIGPTDMAPWLKALADIGYRGYVNPFMHHEPEPDQMDVALEAAKVYLQRTYARVFA